MKSKEKENEKVSLESMERLAQVMNDSPTLVKLGETEFAITALKPGTQWLIAEESCKILKAEKSNMTDVIKQFSVNIPTVVTILTLAILNDRDRIFSDYKKRVKSKEFDAMYQTIMWETDNQYWISLLVEVLNLLSLDYFFQTTNAIAMIREMALGRKESQEETEQ